MKSCTAYLAYLVVGRATNVLFLIYQRPSIGFLCGRSYFFKHWSSVGRSLDVLKKQVVGIFSRSLVFLFALLGVRILRWSLLFYVGRWYSKAVVHIFGSSLGKLDVCILSRTLLL